MTMLSPEAADVSCISLPQPIDAQRLTAAAARLRPLWTPDQLTNALRKLMQPDWTYIVGDDLYLADTLILTLPPSAATARSGKVRKPYQVTAQSCTCPGAVIRGRGCYHPACHAIVAEALEPATSIRGTISQRAFIHLVAFVLTADAPLLRLTVDSGLNRLLLGTDGATGSLALDLPTSQRAALRITATLTRSALQTLTESLDVAPTSTGDRLELEVDSTMLTAYIQEDDSIPWIDGTNLSPLPTTTTITA